MLYEIRLENSEPCDVYIIAKETEKAMQLYAVIVEAKRAYCHILDNKYQGNSELELVCKKHSFTRTKLELKLVDDLALVDGIACYKPELTDEMRDIINDTITVSSS